MEMLDLFTWEPLSLERRGLVERAAVLCADPAHALFARLVDAQPHLLPAPLFLDKGF